MREWRPSGCVQYFLQTNRAQQLASQAGKSEKMADTHGVKSLCEKI